MNNFFPVKRVTLELILFLQNFKSKVMKKPILPSTWYWTLVISSIYNFIIMLGLSISLILFLQEEFMFLDCFWMGQVGTDEMSN